VPRRGQCDNLLVPVCVSSSHIAFGSIRMEPVFMILGQSAATAAALAIDAGTAVQDVPYPKLRGQLIEEGQVLEFAPASGARSGSIAPGKLDGIVVDDSKAIVTGTWKEGTAASAWVGASYRHDGNTRDGRATARFETRLPKSGRYEVRLGYTSNGNRSSRVAVEVHHASGRSTVQVNQQQAPSLDGLFVSLGTFEFIAEQPAMVSLSNAAADGYVVIDAVQWLALDK
jgi:hypothetical protein